MTVEAKPQEGTPPAPVAAGGEPQQQPQTPPKPAEDPHQSELAKARKEAATYRKKLREIEEAKAKAEADALAQQGKHKELNEVLAKQLAEKDSELQRLSPLAERYSAQADAEFASLPDSFRAALPSGLSVDQKLSLAQAWRSSQPAAPAPQPKAPTIAATAPKPPEQPGNGPPKPTDAELVELYTPATKPERKAELKKKLDTYRAR